MKLRWISAILAMPCLLIWAAASATAQAETLGEFQAFLESSARHASTDEEERKAFFTRTNAFWQAHLQDYLQGPGRYSTALSLYHENRVLRQADVIDIDLDRWQEEIDTFRHFEVRNSVPERAILFIGSSSIARWETARAFPSFSVVNRGFGGATFGEIDYYYEEVIAKHRPRVVVLYCDSDIELGRSAGEVVRLFANLTSRITKDFPGVKILFLAMKAAPIDDLLGKHVRSNKALANEMIRDYIGTQPQIRFVDVATPMLHRGAVQQELFLPDGVHLSAAGYELWSSIVAPRL